VLLSLQSNALKFTKKGEVKHCVQIIEELDHKTKFKEKFLKITVKDTGIGIQESDQDKLFKLFGFVQST
jgi:signal transduction histidine kinase